MTSTEGSITVVRGNPTDDEIAAIEAALSTRVWPGQEPHDSTPPRRWGTPASNLGLTRPDPWGRATDWRTSATTTDLWSS